eukprot:2226717-Pleurochrysis_carterae.AAC.4
MGHGWKGAANQCARTSNTSTGHHVKACLAESVVSFTHPPSPKRILLAGGRDSDGAGSWTARRPAPRL